MDKIIEELGKIGIVPVIVIQDPDKAAPLAEALCKGGLPAAEVTFRTEGADKAIAAMKKACPHMIVGAGTVLTTAQADAAIAAGAEFIVSPGLDEEVVKHCQAKGVPMLPGCATPSEVEKAAALGLTEVKFFPAEQAGGLAMIKAMAAPFVSMSFMPTGGLNEKNIGAYLEYPRVIACGGSFMANGKKLAEGDFEGIAKDTARAVDAMLGLTFVSCENGRITLASKMPERAVYHMTRRGASFDEGTAKYGNAGLESIDGTGIRLVRR
ncbi:bifunctional 4-hydroxy-2-oxoglutarate aldolase/2-dehydro-3-deoxy-phosphogluconate aldolase [Ruminococcus sp.]|uniref:bifunctional 4-hydroxy-2-oxoglutarate aldolase/2-dehydro-3-deoxy-phosphogluconate aldolase n=1 Tax=Ruminococcus sp. TaxID=41978 RepID=UPI0025CC472F|nr:bifunctional 4-hydroxy-2-oxoglutarate aldolase/2-dehydro-3-deoxy-phosphogluconate aldolase [Ruminococcus sp.]MBQ8968043.1 bifunctional 4-hydroxy-2-oxoglutarate aldolase/2-dehydro-3-deoxy-phosphogluconate aldolase [Ruminococcus sp.]